MGYSSVQVLTKCTSCISADLSVAVPAKPRSPAMCPKEAQTQCIQITL